MNSLFEKNPNAFSVDIKKQRLSQVFLRQPLHYDFSGIFPLFSYHNKQAREKDNKSFCLNNTSFTIKYHCVSSDN